MNLFVISMLVAVVAASPLNGTLHVRGTSSASVSENDICLMACYPEKTKCGSSSVSAECALCTAHDFMLTLTFNSTRSKWAYAKFWHVFQMS
jgi:hypothetical protein